VRIERLALERYGAFTDRTLPFRPGAALHVVLGANEAGKTSALAAIGDFLFGFGARTDYDFRHDGKTLRIGASLRQADGTLITARRRKGNKRTLLDDQDRELSDDLLAPLLAGLTRPSFDTEFGLTARALRQGGEELLKAGGRLAETLAASSAGMTALSRIKDRLQLEADELFTARRSGGKPFYVAAERRDAADRALRDAVVTREAIRQAETAVEEAQQRLGQLNDAHRDAGATLARWQRTLRVKSPLARLDRIAAELAALADLPEVAAAALDEWQAALVSHANLDQEIVSLDQAAAADAAEIASLAVNDDVLAEGAAIDALRERLGAVRKAIEDLPRRRQARDSAEALLNDAARRLGLSTHVELLQRLPTDPALAQARALIEQIRQAEQTIAKAGERLTRATRERDEYVASEDAVEIVLDVAQAKQRFDALGDIPGQAELRRRDSAVLKREADNLAAHIASLDPCPGAIETIRSLPLPDGAAIAKFANAFEVGEVELQRLQQAIAGQDAEIARLERDLARLAGEASVPTRAELIEVRRVRDLQLDASRAALDADRERRALLIDQLANSSTEIDDVTDRLLSDTERATRREDAERRLAALRRDREAQVCKCDGVLARLAEIERQWAQLWAPSGLTPRNAGEMLHWREKIDRLLEQLARRDAQQAALDALAATLDSGKAAVIAFLDWTGRAADPQLPAEVLYREARARLDALQSAWTEAKTRSIRKQAIERDLREAAIERDAAYATRDGHRAAWPAAMTAVGLSGEATPAQADAALNVWNEVKVPRANHESEGHRVATIVADLAAFDSDVFTVVDRAAPRLKGASAEASLATLAGELTQARRDSETRRRLREAESKRAVQRTTLLTRRAATEQLLDDARRVFGVAEIAALVEPLQCAAARQALQLDQAQQRRDLLETEGHDEAALRQEREGLDLDSLEGEIEREQLRQALLLKEIGEASVALSQAQAAREQLSRGRNAAAAAAERAEAGAELIALAERWLLRAAAARLASRAIERHRALVQDPLIDRAGALFKLATAEAFAGLGVDYSDDGDPMLVAKRRDGERVAVSGLSEGTRDQLYLALRLALLERHTSEPIPFIGDDLLASFDEARTQATLKLFVEAGRARQIILFTHHRHVADLARALPGEVVDLIEL